MLACVREEVKGSMKLKIIKLKSTDWIRLIFLLATFIIMIVNSMFFKLPVVGIPVSLAILYVISDVVGAMFFPNDKPFFRKMLGFTILVMILALLGSALILVGKFSVLFSLFLVFVLGLVFLLFSMGKRRLAGEDSGGKKRRRVKLSVSAYMFVSTFLFFVSLCFYALLTARTGEGRVSVWQTIPSFFLSVFLFSALFLVFIFFFTRVSGGLKLALVSMFSFLAHSLFVMVWYPGRYGDPWLHLGEARVIDSTGAPYAYERLLSRFALLELLGSKAQYALVVLFKRMFCVDIYWVHIVFIPFFWSFFVSLFSYKIAELLTSERDTIIPLLAAVSGLFVPTLIIWGAVSVPNSLGFVFFLQTILLLLYWIKDGRKGIWFMALLTSLATSLAHPQTGIFAVHFFLLTTVFQKMSRKFLKLLCYVVLLAVYPLVLFWQRATFSLEGIFVLSNFFSFQRSVITVPFVFGALGLFAIAWIKRVKVRNAIVLLIFYLTVLFEYYITAYGMKNLPFGAGRILVMAELLLVPFIALGIWAIFHVLRKLFLRVKIGFLKKTLINPGEHFIASLLICLLLSSQAALTLYLAYPSKEIVEIQPSAYELEAIYYIDSTAPGRYVVLADTQLVSLAIGFLGSDYAYGANPKGIVGVPEFWFRTIKDFYAMSANPSISILKNAMQADRATVAYFVVTARHYDFTNLVQKTSEILPVERVFGDGKLYIFKYPLPIIEEVGPTVKVTFDDGASSDVETELSYMFTSEANFTLTLSGHSSYNVTDYPSYWTFFDLEVNNGTKEASFDESSDVSSFIYVKDLLPNDDLKVTWQANLNYPNVLWKDESLKTGWHTHESYKGTIKPQIATDGNILSLSWDFTPGEYQYYYYVKDCNVTLSGSESLIVRWRSTGPIAVVVAYMNSEGEIIVPFGRQSEAWSRTIFRLPPGTMSSIMVGISNVQNQDISGFMALYIDYILISAK